MPVRRSNQLSYEATDVGSWSFVGSNVPLRNEWVMKLCMKWTIIIELRIWSQVSYDPRSYGRNFSNCAEKPEKVRTSTGFEPVTSRCWCDALTNWFLVLLSNLRHQQTSAPSTETMSVLPHHNQYLHASILFLWRKVILPSLEESILNPKWLALRIYSWLKVNNRQTFFN